LEPRRVNPTMLINDVRRGGLVYWDVSGTHTDHHIVEAEILALNATTVRCIRRQIYHRVPDGPYTREIPVDDSANPQLSSGRAFGYRPFSLLVLPDHDACEDV